MREVFRLPDVGEGIAEAEIVEYLVKVGDNVKADQPVVRIETDKAVVELPAPVTGKVVEIPHEPGSTVKVGDALLIIETEAAARKQKPRLAAEKEKAEAEEGAKAEDRPKPAAKEEKAEEHEEEPTKVAPEALEFWQRLTRGDWHENSRLTSLP